MPRDLVGRGKVEVAGRREGMRTSLAPFFVGELLLLLLVRGERKYEGAGAPHCAPGRATRIAPRATFPRYSRVYVSAPPTARRIPQVDVTGIEPATACLQSPGLSTFDHTLRFFSGWGIGDPVVGGRTPFAGLVPAVLGVHAPSRHS